MAHAINVIIAQDGGANGLNDVVENGEAPNRENTVDTEPNNEVEEDIPPADDGLTVQ